MDAGLEEDPYLGALGEVEVAGGIALERGADTFRKLLLRLYNYIAVALWGGGIAACFFFYVAHGNDNSYKFHNTIKN